MINPIYLKEHVMARRSRRRYNLFNLFFDIFLVCITGGFWLIWIFVREMRG